MSIFVQIQVIDYYSKKGLVANLHAEKPPKEVTTEVQKVLSSWSWVYSLNFVDSFPGTLDCSPFDIFYAIELLTFGLISLIFELQMPAAVNFLS